MIENLEIDISKYKTPTRKYFSRSTLIVAKSLPGSYLRHKTPDGILGGMIVETEAYIFTEPGCHAYRGVTNRNRVMFGPPGYAYTYFTYGNHWLFNIVTEKEGRGCAVLIRALEPMEGIDLMWGNRPKAKREIDLANGPGKLASAMRIGREQYGLDLLGSELKISNPESRHRKKIVDSYGGIVTTTRIGLSMGGDLPYRFYLADHPCVSVRAKGRLNLVKP